MSSRGHLAPKALQIRKARVPQAPYSSPPLSPATESVYSCDDYSPRSPYAPDSAVWPPRSGYPISLIGLDDETATLPSHEKEKPSSILSDDDFVSFTSSTTPTPMDRDAAKRRESEAGLDLSDVLAEEEVRRDLGPKMRFVSPAPWEMGDDDAFDPDQDDEFVGLSDALSMISGKFGGWKYREPEKVTLPNLPTVSMQCASPSSSSFQESFRMGQKTQELDRDNVSTRSMRDDSTSIQYSDSPRSSDSTDDKPSLRAPRHPPSRTRDRSPPESHPNSHSRPFRGQSRSRQRERDESPFRSSSPPLPPPNRIFHPYAHPEVVASSESLVPPPTTPRINPERLFDEQYPNAGLRRSSESDASSAHNMQSAVRKGSAPEMPTRTRQTPSKSKMAPHEEEDEKPLKASPVPSSNAWPGPAPFSDYSSSPMANLISLEQARARIQQERANVAAASTPPKSTPAIPSSFATPPSTDVAAVSTPRQRTTSAGKRSISGGEGDSSGPPKLKHKRSAFMKLFTGKEKDSPPKDTISISDPILTPPRINKDSSGDIPPVPSLPGSSSIKRVPPPSLSIVVSSPSMGHSDSDGQESIVNPPSPPQTINVPSNNSSKYLSSNYESRRTNPRPPASAPPSQTTFEGLSLRPVSTMFSAKFTDLLGQFASPPADELSFPSSTSTSNPNSNSSTPNAGPSPTLPAFETSRTNSMSTASDYPLTPSNPHGLSSVSSALSSPSSSSVSENPSFTIASLQAEMANLRKIHQRQVWELEGQIRDLKEEMNALRAKGEGECQTCGKEKEKKVVKTRSRSGTTVGVVDRPRPKAARPLAERTVFGGGIE